MVVEMAWAKPSLEGATCIGTLWPNGTLFEMVRFNKGNQGPDELTQDELDRWIESFPIQ
jgi:hypothetical protein